MDHKILVIGQKDLRMISILLVTDMPDETRFLYEQKLRYLRNRYQFLYIYLATLSLQPSFLPIPMGSNKRSFEPLILNIALNIFLEVNAYVNGRINISYFVFDFFLFASNLWAYFNDFFRSPALALFWLVGEFANCKLCSYL